MKENGENTRGGNFLNPSLKHPPIDRYSGYRLAVMISFLAFSQAQILTKLFEPQNTCPQGSSNPSTNNNSQNRRLLAAEAEQSWKQIRLILAQSIVIIQFLGLIVIQKITKTILKNKLSISRPAMAIYRNKNLLFQGFQYSITILLLSHNLKQHQECINSNLYSHKFTSKLIQLILSMLHFNLHVSDNTSSSIKTPSKLKYTITSTILELLFELYLLYSAYLTILGVLMLAILKSPILVIILAKKQSEKPQKAVKKLSRDFYSFSDSKLMKLRSMDETPDAKRISDLDNFENIDRSPNQTSLNNHNLDKFEEKSLNGGSRLLFRGSKGTKGAPKKSITYDFGKRQEIRKKTIERKFIMHGVLEKLNRENDRRFKDILKEQASSLDQCFLIFDSHTKSIFSNYQKEKWKSVLKSIDKYLNFGVLDTSLTPLWNEIFTKKEEFMFQMRSETTKNLFNLINYLSQNMISFKIDKFADTMEHFEKNINAQLQRSSTKSLNSRHPYSQNHHQVNYTPSSPYLTILDDRSQHSIHYRGHQLPCRLLERQSNKRRGIRENLGSTF